MIKHSFSSVYLLMLIYGVISFLLQCIILYHTYPFRKAENSSIRGSCKLPLIIYYEQ